MSSRPRHDVPVGCAAPSNRCWVTRRLDALEQHSRSGVVCDVKDAVIQRLFADHDGDLRLALGLGVGRRPELQKRTDRTDRGHLLGDLGSEDARPALLTEVRHSFTLKRLDMRFTSKNLYCSGAGHVRIGRAYFPLNVGARVPGAVGCAMGANLGSNPSQ